MIPDSQMQFNSEEFGIVFHLISCFQPLLENETETAAVDVDEDDPALPEVSADGNEDEAVEEEEH